MELTTTAKLAIVAYGFMLIMISIILATEWKTATTWQNIILTSALPIIIYINVELYDNILKKDPQLVKQ